MRRDFILRLAEQVARMLATILAHRQAGRTAEAEAELESSCQRHVGLPFSMVRRSSPEVLSGLLQQSGGLRHARAILLAELLLLDAELSEAAHRPGDALRSQLQAFCLLVESLPALKPDEAAHYRPKLDGLARKLASSGDDPYIQQKLQGYQPQPAAPTESPS